MKVKRALLIAPLPPPIGGDTVHSFNLCRSRFWKESGIEVECIDTSAGDRVRLAEERLTFWDVARGVTIFARVLVRLPYADVVLLWANSRFLLAMGPLIVVLATLIGKPVIAKIFGTYLSQRIRRFPEPLRSPVLTILKGCRYILPETKALRDDLVEHWGFPAAKVVVVPNFVPDFQVAERFRQRGFSGRCVFIGQIKREKGVFEIIEALRARRGLSCDFYGPIVDRDRERFLLEVSRWENLEYRGTIEPVEVSEVLDNYDLLLLPTYQSGEGVPPVVLQAFARGLPVILSEWLSLSELVGRNERGVLVPPKSAGALREAVLRIRGSQGEYDAMCRNAHEWVKPYAERAVVRDTLIGKLLDQKIIPDSHPAA